MSLSQRLVDKQRITEAIVTQSNLEGRKLLAAIKAETSAIKSVKDDTTELQNLFITKLKIDTDDKVFSWLSVPDMAVNRANIEMKRQPDTGLWFTNSDIFKNWKTS